MVGKHNSINYDVFLYFYKIINIYKRKFLKLCNKDVHHNKFLNNDIIIFYYGLIKKIKRRHYMSIHVTFGKKINCKNGILVDDTNEE